MRRLSLVLFCMQMVTTAKADLATRLVDADVVLVGTVAKIQDVQTEILNKDGAPTSEVTAVLVTIKVECVMKGTVADRVELLFWPLRQGAGDVTFPLDPFRIPTRDERLLLLAVRPRVLDGSCAAPIDEERFLVTPSKDTLVLPDLFGEEPAGFYELPTKFVLPPPQSNLVRSIASTLAAAAMNEMDGRLSWLLWLTLSDFSAFTKATDPQLYEPLGNPSEFEKWVRTDLSPKVREWCLTRTPAERVLAFCALVSLGDRSSDSYFVRELLAFETRGEPVPSGLNYGSLECLSASAENWEPLLRLAAFSKASWDPPLRAWGLIALRKMISSGRVQIGLEGSLRGVLHRLLSEADRDVPEYAVWLLVQITGDTQHAPNRYRAAVGTLAPECLEYWKERTR